MGDFDHLERCIVGGAGEIALPWLNSIFIALAALLLIPVAVFCAECIAAMLPGRRLLAAATLRPEHDDPAEEKAAAALQDKIHPLHHPSVAVIIPAHNEEELLAETLNSLLPQLDETDRVVVVADNCTDTTAAIARSFGVTVIERRDDDRLGKGFALDFGLQHLREDAPDIVIMIDADCLVRPGAIDALVEQIIATGRPAQACYLMERPATFNAKSCVSTLAFLVKNLVRPRGLLRMGLPCMLTGTGMAFPWKAIAKTKLASPNIVEDMQLGLDLALDNDAPLFCGDAHVMGRLPRQEKIAYGQRTRWEHGHLRTIVTQAPRMFRVGLRHRRGQAVALAMDLSVPPLALLILVLSTLAALAIGAGLLGASWIPARLLIGGITAVVVCLLGAWARFGRGVVPIAALVAAPIYIAWKVPMYFAFLFKRQTAWNRTARDSDDLLVIPVVDTLRMANDTDPSPQPAASLLTAAGMRRLARALNKSAPQEKTLFQQLQSGLDQLSVTDPAPLILTDHRGLLDHEPAGPALVYQSFLRGFVTELGGRNDFSLGHVLRSTTDQTLLQQGPLGRLRAVILLGGAVRPSRLGSGVGRSVLDLPLEDGRSILWHWRDHVIELREMIGLDLLPVRVMVDQASHQPTAPSRGTQVRVAVERDALQYRGTAGVLRDACDQYDADDYVLVATAAQAMLQPLSTLVSNLADAKADVALVSHNDGSPSGIMLVRCGALKKIAAAGYVDLKEQALPLLAKEGIVRHLPHAVPTGLPVRNFAEYIAAVQYRYRRSLGRPVPGDPFAEDCQTSFAIIEDGACVHPSASVHDSVILRGAHVGPNVVAVRSVIGPGIFLSGGDQVVDRLMADDTTVPIRPDRSPVVGHGLPLGEPAF